MSSVGGKKRRQDDDEAEDISKDCSDQNKIEDIKETMQVKNKMKCKRYRDKKKKKRIEEMARLQIHKSSRSLAEEEEIKKRKESNQNIIRCRRYRDKKKKEESEGILRSQYYEPGSIAEEEMKKRIQAQNRIKCKRYRDKKKKKRIEEKISLQISNYLSMTEEEKMQKRKEAQNKIRCKRYRDKKNKERIEKMVSSQNNEPTTIVKEEEVYVEFEYDSQIAGPSTRKEPYFPTMNATDISTGTAPNIPESLSDQDSCNLKEHTDGEDDTSQESQAKDEASDMEEETNTQNQNGGSSEIHEITSDEGDDDASDEESLNTSSNDSGPDSPQHINKDPGKENNEEDMENGDDESDIEEVSMEDPLHQNSNTNKNKPIIVNDTKSLVELAGKHSNSTDKEPTVVIIDTNTIMTGKGPISLEKVKAPTTTPSSSVDAQHLCQSIAARGTTITAVSVKSSNSIQNSHQNSHHQQQTAQPLILPSLTDDMYVVEAPSFMVPYVYEKPSLKPFREFVDELGRELEEVKQKQEQEKAEKQKALKEKKEKERQERIANGEEVSESENEAEKEEASKRKAEKKEARRQRTEEDDDSWDGESTDSEESNPDGIIKHKDTAEDAIKDLMLGNDVIKGKSDSYFDCTLGKFFINIGLNLVQEYVQSDLLKQQNRKLYKEKKSGRSTKATEAAITSLSQNYEYSKKMNAPYALEMKKCDICSFKTESSLVMKHHLEAPHMRSNIYKCNNCSFEIRSPHDILFHMEAMHNIRGRLERAPAYQQCANCTFEDNSKSKLARHLIACAKKFKPEANLAPPLDWEPPAKIPKLTKARNNAYPQNINRQTNVNNVGRPLGAVGAILPGMMNRPTRGRPPMTTLRGAPIPGAPLVRGGLMIMHNSMNNANYPMLNNQGNATPKISITPLPRVPQAQPVQPANKGTFVICEICDGYIKDLEQLRNHMQWIHKVKIHPKMIYNRPPLNCQKCQFRFFTDQGLERHLLGSHGLVTSSMQDAANKGKDAGRCPVCGRVYQWKLLNHVARDHNMTLKPAHLSYKCTVCTATFGMYKQFENHVYSAHSVVAKRVMDKNKPTNLPAKPDGELLKPIKINDEITIIPQPNKSLAATTSKDK